MADFHLARPQTYFGGSTDDLTEDWWTWVLSAPNGVAQPNQPDQHQGEVFFVAGNNPFGVPEPTDRTFEVPDDPLLIPLVNTILIDENNLVPRTASWARTVTDFHITIDGEEIQHPERYAALVPTGKFDVGAVPVNSVLDIAAGGPGSIYTDESYDYSSAANGYWVLVDRLSPGEHTIEFGGATNNGFSTDTTIHVTVNPDFWNL